MAEIFQNLADQIVSAANPEPAASAPLPGLVQLPGQGGAPGAYTIDPGAAMSSYLSAFNPALMQQIFDLEQQYGTRFQEMDIAARDRNLNAFTNLIGNLTNTAGNVARDETRTQSQFEVDRMGQFGGASIAAYINANPYLRSAMDRSDALGGVSTNQAYDALSRQLLGGAPSAINLSPERIAAERLQSGGMLTPQQVQAERVAAERVRAGQVQAGTVGGGALGESLYQQALRGQEMSPVSAALQQQALQMAQAPGGITPDEMRAATQGARERFAGSGRLADNAAIAGEALARAGASRERQMQDLAAAQQINQQLLGAQQMGQQLATDVLRTDIQRQQANVGNQLQAGQFNVDAMLRGDLANQQTNLQANLANQDAFLRAQLANQQASMQADQFNIQNQQDVGRFNIQSGMQAGMFNAENANRMAEANRGFNYTAQQDYLRNLGLLGQATQGVREADRAYNLNQLGAYGNVSNAGLQAVGYGQQAPGVSGAMNYFQMGSQVNPSQRFDPNAGVNLAATNAANLSNYGASIYGANQARLGAEAQAAAARSAGKSAMVGNIIGAAGSVGAAFFL